MEPSKTPEVGPPPTPDRPNPERRKAIILTAITLIMVSLVYGLAIMSNHLTSKGQTDFGLTGLAVPLIPVIWIGWPLVFLYSLYKLAAGIRHLEANQIWYVMNIALIILGVGMLARQ